MSVITNTKSNKKITGTTSADTIFNSGSKITISGGAGDDYIQNYSGSNVSLSGGAGNDAIATGAIYSDVSSGKNVTITGGAGHDYITSMSDKGVLYEYTSGDGNDFINGFNSNDTLKINGSSYATMTSGGDFVIFVGSGSITLKHAANIPVKIKNSSGKLITYNSNASNILYGTDYADVITSTTKNSTVLGYADNDTVWNYVDNVVIYGGDGHDDISSFGNSVKISGGNGAESIESTGNNGIIFGDAGTDTIIVHQGKNNTLEGGANNDVIVLENSEGHNAINYRLGDGYDTIYGFTSSDVLWAYDIAWNTSTIGNDVVLNFQNGAVTLKNVATIRPRLALNITDNTTTGTIGALTEIIDAYTRTKGIKITCNTAALVTIHFTVAQVMI